VNRVLVDTQALIWFADGAPALSSKARELIDDSSNVTLASAASLWEMAIKIPLGKLHLKSGTLREFSSLLKVNDIEVLAVCAEDAISVLDLPRVEHKDPFDRLIAAQCLRQDLTLVSIDAAFDAYGVRRVW
jgi:PIN domain nuclease of toxin-antitoxin system